MATDLAPFVGTIGGGFFIGFITGYAIKKVIKLAHQGTSQYSPSTIFRPPRMDHQSYGTGLSQETIAKLEELKRLVYKYPQFHNIDPDKIVRWAVHGAISGDNTFLDEKLKQLVSLDFYNV